MSNSPETSIFGISDASAVDRTPYRVKEPWMKGRWIFRYTVGFDLIDGLAREPVNFKVYFLIFNKINSIANSSHIYAKTTQSQGLCHLRQSRRS